MGRVKSVLSVILILSLIVAIWNIWGKEGNLDVFFSMLWDWAWTVLQAFASVWQKAWEAFHS